MLKASRIVEPSHGGWLPAARIQVPFFITHEHLTSAGLEAVNDLVATQTHTPTQALAALTRKTVEATVRDHTEMAGALFTETCVDDSVDASAYKAAGGRLVDVWRRVIELFPDFEPPVGTVLHTIDFAGEHLKWKGSA